MQKLVDLRAFLLQQDLWDDNKMESWVDSVQLKISGKGGPEGLKAGDVIYQAVIVVDRYNYSRHPIEILMTKLGLWLMEHDDNRDELDESDPDISVDVLDDHTADLEIVLWFKESIHLVAHPEGEIEAFGYNWNLQQPTLLVAENLLGVNGG